MGEYTTGDKAALNVLVTGFLNGESVKAVCDEHDLPYQQTLDQVDAYVEQGLIETEGQRRGKTYIPQPAAFEALGYDVTDEVAQAVQTAQATGAALDTYLDEQDLDALQEQAEQTAADQPADHNDPAAPFTEKTWQAVLAAGEVFGRNGSMTAFQEALDVSYPTAKKRRETLEDEGLVYTEKQGSYHLTPAMRELLAEHGEHHDLDPDAFTYVDPDAAATASDTSETSGTAATPDQTGDETAEQVEAIRSDLEDEGLLPDEESDDDDPLLAEDGVTAVEQDQQYREQADDAPAADPATAPDNTGDANAPIHERLGHLVEGATIEWEQEENTGIDSRDLTDEDTAGGVGIDDGLEDGGMDFLDELDEDTAGYEGFT